MELSEDDPWFEIDESHIELLNHQPPILHTISKKNLHYQASTSACPSLKLKQSQMVLHDINCKKVHIYNLYLII